MQSNPSRRDVFGALLKVSAGAALFPLVNCASDSAVDATTPDAGDLGSCSTIPEETAGPFPGDGTNGKNALTLDGIVRQDIRSSIGASGVATGVPLTVTLALVDAATCELANHAVYIWHCDRDGNYSMYSAAIAGENYLRGVQVSDAEGRVTFTTVFPGCYDGRWPHIHFEVYATLADTTSGRNAVATSQLALPKSTCETVYATAGYASSASNLTRTSIASDNVFGDDDGVFQVPAISGSVAGFDAQLVVAVTG